jgi:hypothetical protein
MKRGYRLVRAGILGLSRGEAVLQRALGGLMRGAGGFLSEALTQEERDELGAALYDHAFAAAPRSGLFLWERDWFARRLPPAPARLLVGGAGDGREAVALQSLGYLVDAFDPAARAAAACAARLGARARVAACRYEDLSRAVLEPGDLASPAAPFASERYAAILLGWGSLTHVLEAAEQERLLAACDRLCPEGPILASFWLRSTDEEPAPGRAERAGRALGRALGRLRGAEPADGMRFGWWFGFAHAFGRAELEALAARAGRRVLWEEAAGGYPHVTMLRPPPMV